MIKAKTDAEIKTMAEGGRIAAKVLRRVLGAVEPGVRTLDLNARAEELIRRSGAVPAFKGFENFPFTVCANVNEGVVHGLPSARRLKSGDLLSLDLGVYYKGLYTDTAWTVLVADRPLGAEAFKNRVLFLRAGEKALRKAIAACRVGGRVGDISAAIQAVVEQSGFNVVRGLVGHGVGRELHEEPQVPCFGRRGTGAKLVEGLVLAVEVIYTAGGRRLSRADDGWTIKTLDGGWGGLFEHTVAVTSSGPIVLTAEGNFC